MEKKVGLNNTQRKMLDEVYMEQFDKIERASKEKRTREREVLSNKVLAYELKTPLMKILMKSIGDAYTAFKKSEKYMKDNGLSLENNPHESELRIGRGWNSLVHPDMRKFDDETSRIEEDFAKSRKEIRARIYGMETTYAEVEGEIAKYIANIKQ